MVMSVIIVGYFGGALLAFYLSKWLLGAISDRFSGYDAQSKSIKVVGAIFGAIALAPAVFLAIMVGGVVGVKYATLVSEAIGLGGFGMPVVLALGLIVLTAVTVTVTAIFGAGLGFLAARRPLS